MEGDPVKMINLVKLSRKLEEAAIAADACENAEDSSIARALAGVVEARAEGSRGLGARVDAVLEQLAKDLDA